jgi:hypothetical protein
MSQKSSLPQVTQFVSGALPPDRRNTLTKAASSSQPSVQPGKTADATPRTDTIRVKRQEGETDDQATARELMDPSARHSITVLPHISCSVGNTFPQPKTVELSGVIRANAEQAQQGNHAFPRVEKIAAAIARCLPLAPDEPALHAYAYELRIHREIHGVLRVHFNAIVFH